MGAGKTTLIKALCAHLGVDEIVKSPTFALVNEYQHREGRIFHFDFYRIVRIEEAYDMGIEEYFGSGEYCFVEWPEKIEDLIPQSACRIDIKWISEDERQITVKVSAASDE